MADDWKPGDKGICIKGGPWYEQFAFFLINAPGGPERGDIIHVHCTNPIRELNALYLGLQEHPGYHYDAVNFRKLPPSSEKHVEALKTSIKEPTRV